MSLPTAQRATVGIPLISLLAAAVALAVRAALAAQPIDLLDRWFVPDDTYYTLAIVRTLAAGLGPSIDGLNVTTGFQPLLAFLLVPAAWVTSDPDALLRIAVGFSALVDAGNAALLARLAGRHGGRAAALIAGGAWALSPLAVRNALGGLETALALAAILLVAEAYRAVLDRPSSFRALALGGLCGLAVLARIDTLAAVAVAVVGLMLRRETWPRIPALAFAFAAVLAPWWAYSFAKTGSVLPESGQAVREQVAFHRSLYLDSPRAVAWAAGYLVAGPFADARTIRDRLAAHPRPVAAVAGVGVLLLSALLARRALRRETSDLDVLVGSGLAVVVFYSLYLPALWFFRRYLAPAEAATCLAVALALGGGRGLRSARMPLRVVAWIVLVVGFGAAVRQLGATWLRDPRELDQGLHGAKGYRAPARELLEQMPAGTVVGALQSGALSYYAAARDVRVVNLDGVVDGAAAQACRAGQLASYARSRGMTRFADWDFNLRAFEHFSRAEPAARPTLRPIGEASPQGPDRFRLYEVEWN